MNSRIPLLALLTLGLPALPAAGAAVALVNAGFEQPATVKINAGFDAATDIPGWTNNNAAGYGDSGVESPGTATHQGSWVAYLRSTDGGAYQVSGHTISTGDAFTLTWLAAPTSGEAVNTTQLVTLFRSTDGGATRTVLATFDGSFGATNRVFSNFTLNYTATAADAGALIGIEFDYTLPTNAWAAYDNFALDVVAVPEPSALLLGGLGLAGLLRRRRA